METTNKQTIVKQEMLNIFGSVYTINNSLVSPLNDTKDKAKKIDRLKDYLNTNFDFYLLSIVFTGGTNLEYNTSIKIEI